MEEQILIFGKELFLKVLASTKMPSVFRKKFLKKIDNDFFKNLKKAIEKKRTSIGGRKQRFCPNNVRTKSLGGKITTLLKNRK